MTGPRRVVVCWPQPGALRSGWAVQQRGLLNMAGWCATRRLYPGPGRAVLVIAPDGIQAAAHALHVHPADLFRACHHANRHGRWVEPLIAVAAEVRPLNQQQTAPAWRAAA